MNELLFFVHVTVIIFFTIAALKVGKEALIALISIFCILANLFVTKQITLFGLHPTASDSFAVGAILGLNLLQEHFGKSIAKKAVWICFFCLIFYTISSQIHLLYTPSIYDFSQTHFQTLLQFMPRLTIVSMLVTLFVQHLDRILYGFLKNIFSGKQFILRNSISLTFILFLDTFLFTFAGLYGIVSNLWQIIIFSYAVKLATTALIIPALAFVRSRHTP